MDNCLSWFLNGDKIDVEAYQKGMEDCHEFNEIPQGENPYEKNTIEWFSYNRGWNTYTPLQRIGIWFVPFERRTFELKTELNN